MKYFLKDVLKFFSKYEIKNTFIDKFFYTVAWTVIRVLILAVFFIILTMFYGFIRFAYLHAFYYDELERKKRSCDIYSQGIIYKDVRHFNQDYDKYIFSYQGRSITVYNPSLSCKYIIIKKGKYRL